MAGGNWIKSLVDEQKAKEARARALALTALAGVNPTDQELAAFQPGAAFPSQFGVAGAVGTPGEGGTVDPALAADLQRQLRNEELQAAATRNAGAVQDLRASMALAEGGVNEGQHLLAREHRAKFPAVAATAATDAARADSVSQVLINPEVDPLLKVDIADKKPVFKSQLVKVRRADGSEVYMNQTPTLSGQPTYTPALDDNGDPLGIPIRTAGGSGGPTALQKNARFIADNYFKDDPDGLTKAIEMLTTLKGKNQTEAWDSLTRFTAKMNYGRYAKDPQRLFDKTVELWRVARPMEPIPRDAPAPPPGVLTPGAAPAAAPRSKPAAAAPASQPSGALLRDARAAIARGANPDAVRARLRSMGGNPDEL